MANEQKKTSEDGAGNEMERRPKRINTISATLTAVLTLKRWAWEVHKPPTQANDMEIKVIMPMAKKGANNVKESGKEICTFEESPFYVHKTCAQGLLPVVENLIGQDSSRVYLKDKAGLTCFHHAVSRNRLQVIDFLLKSGADINAQTPDGNTGLHLAVEKGRADVVRHLLTAGANGNIMNSKRMAPIHVAASLGNKTVVTELCNFPHLVNVNLKGFRGQLALHFAAMGDKMDAAEALLKAGCKLDATSENGFCPIHVAAKCGAVKILQLFLNLNTAEWPDIFYTAEQLLEQVDKEKNNALHMAVNSGNVDSVSICLKYGASVDVRQEDFSTPLHLACAQGSLSIVKLLYETHVQRVGEDEARMVLESKDVLDMSLLHRAAMFDHPDVVRYLLEQKAEIEATDQEKRSSLLLAVACSAFRAFRTLLNSGANVAAVDKHKRNVLHYLVGRSHSTAFTAEEFLSLCQTDEGKRLLNQRDSSGCTPLHLAAKEGTVRCIDTFIPLGANINLKDADDRCPLHFAARYGRYNVVKQLLESPGAVNILNETDGQGMTALHVASMNGHTKVVQLLLYKGALLHKDYLGRSPLHLAAQNDHLKTMQLLLSFHHNLLDQRDRIGNTPLHYAVQANRTRPTELLLSYDCVYSINDNYETPMDIALENQYMEVALAMVKHKRWTEILEYRGAEAFVGLITHLPQICRVVLDRCRTCAFTDPHSHHYWEKYDFRYLQRSHVSADVTEEKMSKQEHKPLEALNTMVAHQRVDLLAHPVSYHYLRMKWRAYGCWIFLAHLLFYSILVACFTAAVLALGDTRVRTILEYIGEDNTLNGTNNTNRTHILSLEITPAYLTAHCIIFGLILLNAVKEFVQLYQQKLLYFTDSINYLEWCLYITGMIAAYNALFQSRIDNLAWQCNSIAIFLSWFNLLMHFQRLDSMGLYVVMFLQILKTMIKVIIGFSVLFIAFGLMFYMLLANTESDGFMSPSIAILRTVMLMMGEFDFVNTYVASLTSGEMRFPSLSYVVLMVFVLLMPILFVNLLIGLAVGDIEMVQKDAQLKRLAMQVEYHTELEAKLPHWLLSRVDKTELVVYPNLFTTKVHIISMIKSRFSRFRRHSKTAVTDAKSTSTVEVAEVAAVKFARQANSVREDPIVLELGRTKRKLRNVQQQLGAVRDLLHLVVRKLDINGDDVDGIDASIDTDMDDDDDFSEKSTVSTATVCSIADTESRWKSARAAMPNIRRQ